jgi:hypothetical protein
MERILSFVRKKNISLTLKNSLNDPFSYATSNVTELAMKLKTKGTFSSKTIGTCKVPFSELKREKETEAWFTFSNKDSKIGQIQLRFQWEKVKN